MKKLVFGLVSSGFILSASAQQINDNLVIQNTWGNDTLMIDMVDSMKITVDPENENDGYLKVWLNDGGTREYSLDKFQGTTYVSPFTRPGTRVGGAASTFIDGNEYVNLGLPSGTLWGTCNLGSKAPADKGYNYLWGQPSSYKKTQQTVLGTGKELYNKGIVNNALELNDAYDAATQKLGKRLRMPNWAEFDELVKLCTWTWTTRSYSSYIVAGYLVTGPNGNSIFLPHTDGVGEGNYWAKDACQASSDNSNSTLLNFYHTWTSASINTSYGPRSKSCYIRPVVSPDDGLAPKYPLYIPNKNYYESGTYSNHKYVDMGLPSGNKWATCNLGASSMEKLGDFFRWGMTQRMSMTTRVGAVKLMTQYLKPSILGSDGNLLPAYDAATKLWGSAWCTPSCADFEELIKNCKVVQSCTLGDFTQSYMFPAKKSKYIVGTLYTSNKNGRQLFLPAGGWCCSDEYSEPTYYGENRDVMYIVSNGKKYTDKWWGTYVDGYYYDAVGESLDNWFGYTGGGFFTQVGICHWHQIRPVARTK